MSRDLLTLTGGTNIGLKGSLTTIGESATFSSSTLYNYNVYRIGDKVYRLVNVEQQKTNINVYNLSLDILSTIYYNSGTCTIQTTRHHLPSRCKTREWGGTQNVSRYTAVPFNLTGLVNIIYIAWTSTHNKLLNTNGECIRYIVPVAVPTLVTTDGWLNTRWPVIVGGDIIGRYPSVMDIITDLDAITGLDGASILDVSFLTLPPYKFSNTNVMFMLDSASIVPNCENEYNSVKFKYYQIDKVSNGFPSYLALSPISFSYTIPADSVYGYNCQDMSVFVDGRKTMDILPYNDTASINVVPFCGANGLGMIVTHGDNVTTVMGGKLPWITDAWLTYQAQKKNADEERMYYDTIKQVASIAIGLGGSAMTGGATAMTVPGSVASLGDAYMSQRYTEQTVKTTPYGSGSPIGDIGSLYYMVTLGVAPVTVTVTKYSGQPTRPNTYGLNLGYQSEGEAVIASGGYYAGELMELTTTLTLSQNEIDILKAIIRRGVKT